MNADHAKFLAGVIGQNLQGEWMHTYKVINAVPEGKKDYKPQENSRTAWELAHHIAICDVGFLQAVAANSFSVFPAKCEAKTVAALADWYKHEFPKALEKVIALDGNHVSQIVESWGMKLPSVWYMMFCNNHMIHHRGQLTTYLRPMGGKVPAMYGESFDEKFGDRRVRSLFAVACALALSACAAASPDTVLLNGKVFTSNPAQPWAEALAIRGDRVIAVGTTAAIGAQAGPNTRRIDLHGRTTVPGINDAHAHIGPHLSLVRLKSGDDPTTAELEAALAEAVAQAAPSQFIQGSFGERVWLDPGVTRAWLDARAPGHPVRLSAWTGHGIVLNSAALKLAGIDESIADPDGGRFLRDEASRLNGRAEEYGVYLAARRLAMAVDSPAATEAYRAFAAEAAALGITTVQLMGDALPVADIMSHLVAAQTSLRWHVYRFPIKEAGAPTTDSRPHLPPQPALNLDARGMKFILDGTPIERLAFLRAPYANAPQERGRLNFTPERLQEFVGWGYGTEDQILMHAVGDGAIDAYLSALERAGLPEVWRDKRPRIEHGDFLFPDLMARAKKLGVVVVQNPAHLTLGPALEAALGADRFSQSEPLKALLTEGVPLALGSDGPLSPFLNIMFATTHPARPSEALSREEAVTAYTRGSAFAEHADKDKGHLSPGALADLAVLSADVFTVPANELPAIKSVLTMVGGRVVHDAGVIGRATP